MKSFFSLLIIVTVIIPTFLCAQNNKDTASKNSILVNDTAVFEKVEVEASFPGGDIAWRRYLEKTLSDFNPADYGSSNGKWTVIVQFVVDKEGNISDVKALTHFGHNMEEKVVQIIKRGPRWNPATLYGKPVKAYRKQPVTFMVSGL